MAGIVPIAPAGLDMARWFGAIEGERLLKLLQLSPVPIPEIVVREVVGRVYSNLAFSTPGRAGADAVASFTSHIPTIDRGQEILTIGRRLLPELRSPFHLQRISCPLLLVWGERDRMVYTTGSSGCSARSLTRMSRSSPTAVTVRRSRCPSSWPRCCSTFPTPTSTRRPDRVGPRVPDRNDRPARGFHLT